MEIAEHTTPARLRTLPSWLINQAAIRANRVTDQALAGLGSRRHHFAMLAALEESGPSSQADLGRCTAIDRSDVAAAIDTLAEQGYVRRGADPSDGRRNVITITTEGTGHLRSLGAAVAAAQDELLRSWSAAERDTLLELLTRIVDKVP
ncbi:MarR family winged helix-turn-helix transcriptional regulator [Microbispora sp. ATCC PTA-5024]|uniref:MarR family winged helix-turn-helix transcriptional regulator n=1 Tax=Microbispora sp. ATCC PTA-5024 TaxID=316330 RepID=UPI0003DDCFDA|nr:MarR family transcriptional regulator [Microbispora sp. ATCC PTA-5024]ETK32947.1 MarR family transcriptional regulator [Microbispora sp. ATCC PTA-5024]